MGQNFKELHVGKHRKRGWKNKAKSETVFVEWEVTSSKNPPLSEKTSPETTSSTTVSAQ